MPQGQVDVYDAFMEEIFDGGSHLFDGTDTYYCAIVDNTAANFDVTTADPHWGGTGTTDLSANEVSGDQYPANGVTCGVGTATLNAGVLDVDISDPATWGVGGANPQNCYYGIVYNFTDAAKKCVAFVDLGGVFDAQTGDLTITWGTPFFTVNQA